MEILWKSLGKTTFYKSKFWIPSTISSRAYFFWLIKVVADLIFSSCFDAVLQLQNSSDFSKFIKKSKYYLKENNNSETLRKLKPFKLFRRINYFSIKLVRFWLTEKQNTNRHRISKVLLEEYKNITLELLWDCSAQNHTTLQQNTYNSFDSKFFLKPKYKAITLFQNV